jgi:hypothetical protein
MILKKIHVLIREEITAESIIPVRKRKREKIKGKYRRKLCLNLERILKLIRVYNWDKLTHLN